MARGGKLKGEDMLQTRRLEVFVRKNRLTTEEWFDLIEDRRKLIKPHLSSFMLPELGLIKCMSNESNFLHELRFDAPVLTGDTRFSLETQGIFCRQKWSDMVRIPNSGYCAPPGGVNCPNGTMWIWGLTCSGLWILATIGFVGESGYKDHGRERAKTVDIIETDIPMIVTKTKHSLQEIWGELGNVIKNWAEHRKTLYEQAIGFAQMVEIEEHALSLVPNK